MTAQPAADVTAHPCPFPTVVLDAIQTRIDTHPRRPDRALRILDPFAGIGRIHDLERCTTWGVEIEPEWAAQHDRTVCYDSRRLGDLFDRPFDVIATSPAYGNRMADQYLPPDSDTSRRYGYAVSLGRPCSEGSGAALQWDAPDDHPGLPGMEAHEGGYRGLHRTVWAHCVRLLRPGGLFLLNVKNHYRAGAEQKVTEWHIAALTDLGLVLVDDVELGTDGIKHSPTRDRFPERLITLQAAA